MPFESFTWSWWRKSYPNRICLNDTLLSHGPIVNMALPGLYYTCEHIKGKQPQSTVYRSFQFSPKLWRLSWGFLSSVNFRRSLKLILIFLMLFVFVGKVIFIIQYKKRTQSSNDWESESANTPFKMSLN